MKKILITGAGGFIGGFIVAEALRRGYETWAAVRESTNRQFLNDDRIRFITLDFTDEEAFNDTLKKHIAENGKWDFVVHNLGATKCANYQDFQRINYGYMRLLVDTLAALDAAPEHFLLMSSLSVMGMGDEKGYTPFRTTDLPKPNTRYGMSKLKAETYLQTQSAVPFTIFRCTGVYGPHERDYFLMMKSIKMGFDFSVGFKKQMLTFIYVEDLATAVLDALQVTPQRRTYFISEKQAYTQKQFRAIVSEELKKKVVIPIVAPIWVVWIVCKINDLITRFSGKPKTLNSDKFRILRQRNWLCDTSDAERDFAFNPRHDLKQGVHKAIEWYKEAKWL